MSISIRHWDGVSNVSLQSTTGPSGLAELDSPMVRRVDFDLEPQDLLAFINYHYVSSPSVRRQRLYLGLLGFVILSALPIMVALGASTPVSEVLRSSWPMLLAPLAFIVCFPLFYRWGLKRTCRRLLDEGDRRGFYGPRSLALEDYGIRETTIRGEMVRAWPSVRKIITIEQHVLVYTSPTEAFVIPKRVFDPTELASFMAFLTRRARLSPAKS
jgi:hypothetical protein